MCAVKSQLRALAPVALSHTSGSAHPLRSTFYPCQPTRSHARRNFCNNVSRADSHSHGSASVSTPAGASSRAPAAAAVLRLRTLHARQEQPPADLRRLRAPARPRPHGDHRRARPAHWQAAAAAAAAARGLHAGAGRDLRPRRRQCVAPGAAGCSFSPAPAARQRPLAPLSPTLAVLPLPRCSPQGPRRQRPRQRLARPVERDALLDEARVADGEDGRRVPQHGDVQSPPQPHRDRDLHGRCRLGQPVRGLRPLQDGAGFWRVRGHDRGAGASAHAPQHHSVVSRGPL